ncbi:hypothetical protein [Corynebacterium diphtheriae]|uniref:hypothetical protein n=1 Tax=Corynebacterium diphtheriae TaxID=1717 RepID=UPI0018CA63B3|nr:hypothetical protein [Corynebacterium diphtheriae]MBG9357099.1 hypothetical protein [Corynebacterium diphtheriae bv. mitis]
MHKGTIYGALCLSTLLAACSPPHQVDTATKVVTAQSFSATTSTTSPPSRSTPEIPGFIDCLGPAMVKPTSITMDCASHDATIQEIKWTKWTQQAAYGTGRIKEKGSAPRTVSIVLSRPVQSAGGTVFIDVSVDGEALSL